MALDWTLHPAGDAPAPVVLVLPGGAYRMLAEHEGAPVARWLNSLGLHAAVLHYTTRPACWPAPLHEARDALARLRAGDVPFPVDAARVGVLGFSAGGHLAGLLATDTPDVPGTDPLTFAGRPDAAVLCYPVTDLRETMLGRLPNLHVESGDNLLGTGADDEVRAELSVPTRITPPQEAALPDFFVWTTSDDDVVPPLHTLGLLTSLAVADVPFEAHLFRSGRHGLGLATGEPEVAQWTDLAAAWFAARGWR